MVRPSASAPAWIGDVEVVRADLRVAEDLVSALDGVDVAMHLALGTPGDDEALLADALVGTERFLDAMARSQVKRLVLASSFVVYDWSKARGTLDETSPLEAGVYRRGAYDIAKVWQERMVSRAAKGRGWDVTVLRPGFIWGRGRAVIGGMGRIAGSAYLLFGPFTRLPLTHVENCADCFAASVDSEAARGETFNVIDGDDVRVWRYAREHARGSGRSGVPVPIPYVFGLGLANLAALTSRLLFGARGRLPSLLTPRRFEAQFKPLRFSNRKLRQVMGWSPPLDFETCLERTYGPEPTVQRASGPTPSARS